jgi:iron complex transport system permease protein
MNVRRGWAVFVVLLILLLGACALSLFAGPSWVPLSEIAESPIVRMRIARILLAIIAGAGLAVSGVIFQALLRNPLAEPYVLGVSSGAGLGAAAAIVLGLSGSGVWGVPALAFAGALCTIFLVYALARTSSGAVPVPTLLLSGVIVGAVLSSILMFIVSTSESEKLHNVMWWLLGSLQALDWRPLEISAPAVAAGLLIAILLSRDLNLMTLGEEPAAHLGLNVEQTKKLFFLVASLMTGATVAACGLIGFVGLIVPHIVRLIIGPDHRRLVPASALAGATFLILADSFARSVLSVEIPIGVVTAFLGGPFFLFILRRRTSPYWR